MTKCTFLGELSLVPYSTFGAVNNYYITFIILTLNAPKPRVTHVTAVRCLEIDLNEYLGGCEHMCTYVFMICSL